MASGYLRECRDICAGISVAFVSSIGEKLGVEIFGLQFQPPFSSLALQGKKSVGESIGRPGNKEGQAFLYLSQKEASALLGNPKEMGD